MFEWILIIGFLLLDLSISTWILFHWNEMSLKLIQFAFFGIALFWFHTTEFLFVLLHNVEFLSVKCKNIYFYVILIFIFFRNTAFLLSNPGYNFFLILSSIEHFVEAVYLPNFKSNYSFVSISIVVGIFLLIVGESFRKTAVRKFQFRVF
jgi:hypothetical protein